MNDRRTGNHCRIPEGYDCNAVTLVVVGRTVAVLVGVGRVVGIFSLFSAFLALNTENSVLFCLVFSHNEIY